jgi:hypothetical protein
MPPKRKQTDAEKALEEVRRILHKASGDELSVLKDFAEVFGAEVEGWEMRVRELEAEAECLQKTGTVWSSKNYETEN